MALGDLVDHVIGVDPDRDRITAAVVCSRTQGELASKVFATTARGYGQAIGPVSLIWPHCDGLIWPHLRHAGALL